jgi:glycosyltransferase involved in cell wall biosynthesis
MSIKLSIVIPVYNVEKYLEKCLNSILDTLSNIIPFEIIAINDGSTDSSLDTLNRIAQRNNIIKVYSRANKGLGATRNEGIKISKGDYIWFIDSDDWILKQAATQLVDSIQKRPDIININYIHSNGKENTVINRAENLKFYRGSDYMLLSVIQSPAQYFIINRNFLLQQDVLFREHIYHEDALFTPQIVSLSRSITYIKTPCYVYNIRENSIMTAVGKNQKHIKDMLQVIDSLLLFSKDNRLDKNSKKAVLKYGSICIGSVNYYSKDLDRTQLRKLLKDLKWGDVLKSLFASNQFKYFVVYFILKLKSL